MEDGNLFSIAALSLSSSCMVFPRGDTLFDDLVFSAGDRLLFSKA
jgi:hypothetical protein